MRPGHGTNRGQVKSKCFTPVGAARSLVAHRHVGNTHHCIGITGALGGAASKRGAEEKVLSFKARLSEGGAVIRLRGATSCDRGSFLPSGPMAVLMEGVPVDGTNLHARQSW